MKIKISIIGLTCLSMFLFHETKAQNVHLVNMIPRSLSNETNEDNEPSIAVNPNNPLHIVATAFTPNPLGGINAPLFVSSDGGNTWSLKSIVPGNNTRTGTNDISLCFSGTADNLYISNLRGDGILLLNVLSCKDFNFTRTATLILSQNAVDQPYIKALTQTSRTGIKTEEIFIGYNSVDRSRIQNGIGNTASILHMTIPAVTIPAGSRSPAIERRQTSSQDAPSVRCCIHQAGLVYGIYSQYIEKTKNIVLVRDDHWGQSNFENLQDVADNIPGRIIKAALPGDLSSLSLQDNNNVVAMALDPTDAGHVYIAYNDSTEDAVSVVHIISSRDSGKIWTRDILTLNNATNPSLAVNSEGRIGIVYQRLLLSEDGNRWQTHFRSSADHGSSWDDLILSDTPENRAEREGTKYLGDYISLVAAGNTFHGVFSALNTPDPHNFPFFPIYHRNVDPESNKLLGTDMTSTVNPSMDPFYFNVSYPLAGR